MDKKADIDRLSVLTLQPSRGMPGAVEHWEKTSVALYDLMRDEDLRGRMLRRSVNMMPRILENIEVFVKVASRIFGSQRDGDQYGTMLAGAWSLTSIEAATPADAEEMINQYKWDEHVEASEEDDSQLAMRALMGAFVHAPGVKITVFDLISVAVGDEIEGMVITPSVARRMLRDNGILINDTKDRLILANQSAALRDLLKDTPYAADTKSVFGRIPGAGNNDGKQVKFHGMKTRVTSLPLSLVGFSGASIADESELF
jgi:putative DNA primase/helicase